MTIKSCTDNKITAEYIRPKKNEEYRQKLWECVTGLKRKTKGHDFNLQEYETVFYSLVSKIYGEIESIGELFRYQAGEEI